MHIRYNNNYSTPPANKSGINSVSCHDGYIKETSPMGTRVCEGNIFYIAENSVLRWTSHKDLGQTCRWR